MSPGARFNSAAAPTGIIVRTQNAHRGNCATSIQNASQRPARNGDPVRPVVNQEG